MRDGQLTKRACEDCGTKEYEVRYRDQGYLGLIPLCRECSKFREDEPYL